MRFLAVISLLFLTFAAAAQSCPTPTIVQTGGTNPSCPGAPVTLDAGEGASYLWSNGATTRSITMTPSSAETVTVVVTNAEGCQATSAPLTITIQAPPAPTIFPAHNPICPNTASQATVVPPAGTTYTQYAWSISGGAINGASNQATVAFTAGSNSVTLSVSVLDSNGCASQRNLTIPIRTISYSAITLSRTQSCPNTALTASIASQTGYSYAWTIANGTLTSSATTPSIAFTTGASGTTSLSCVVTDPQGCKVTKTANVTIRSMTLTSTASPTACLGTASYTASVTNTSGYSGFSWSVSSNATIVSGGTTANMTYRVTNAGPVTLTVTANDSVGSCPSTAILTRQNGTTPEPIVTFDSTVVCSLSQARFTVDNAAAFTGGVNATATNGSVTKVGPATWEYVPMRPAPANMTISVTGRMSSGCPYLKSFVIPIDNPPTPTVTLAPNCPLGVMRLLSSPATRYEWTTSPASSGSGSRTDPTYDMTAAGTYQLTTWDQNDCPATFGPKNVASVPVPTPTIVADGPTTFCEGGSVTLAPSTIGTSYSWKRNGASFASSRTVNVTQPGTYTVTVMDTFCAQTSAPVTVTVDHRPLLSVSISGPLTFCPGGSVTLTAFGDGPITWSNGATTPSITVNASGTYTATTTWWNGCTTSVSKTVTVTTPPSTITASGPTTLCPGGSVTLTAPESASYWWTNGEHTRSITVTTAGSYRVMVTDAAGCRGDSAPVAVTVSNPIADFTLPAAFCLPGNLQLSAVYQPNSTYAWSVSGLATITPATGDPRHATLRFHGAGNVSVTLTVTAASGCSVTQTRTVSAEDPPSIAASALAFCPDESITLAAQPANASYLWSNGETTRQIRVSTAGDYGVTVTTACGRTATVPPVTVTEIQLPEPELAFPTICAEDTEFDVTLTNASAYSFWFFTGNAAQPGPYGGATQHFMRAWHQPTWIDILVRDENGCSRHKRIEIPELPAPDATITTSASTFIEGETYTASVPDAGPGAQYAWEVRLGTVVSGAGTRTITVRPIAFNGNPTQFVVTITGPNGCARTDVKSVPVAEAP